MRNLAKNIFTMLAVSLFIALTAGCSSKAKSERRLSKADDYFKAGDYQKAEVEYLNALQINFTNAHAIASLGTIYYEQSRISRAYAYLNKASELMPDDLEVKLKLGNIDLSVGKAKEAREKAMIVLSKIPKHADAPLLLAESVTTKKDLPEIRRYLEKLSAQIGETASVQLALGILSMRENDPRDAEASVKRAMALDPKSSAAHYSMGNLYLVRSDLKSAEIEFKLASELAPVRSPRRLNYAQFKIKTGELEEGKRLLAQMTKEAPDYLPAWLRQAEIALDEKRYADAASAVEQILSREPVHIEALVLRGRLLLAQGEPVKAIAELERTSQQFTNVPQVHYNLAMAYFFNNKETGKALASLNRAIALNTNYLEAVLLRARLNISSGAGASAIPALLQVVKQQPQVFEAHVLLADAYMSQDKLNEAVAVFRAMMPLFAKSREVPFLLGSALIRQNKMADARTAFEKSLEIAPEYSLALERLVDIDLQDKQYAAATQRVKKQMGKYPKAVEPWLLLAKIHLAQKEFDPAETALLKAIELDPNLQTPYLLLTQIYLASNRQQQAIDKLTALVAKKTNDIGAWMQIGMIQDTMKNYPAARDAYEKILTINPKFGPALNNLAYIYSERLPDLDKAYNAADQAMQLLLQPADARSQGQKSSSDALVRASSADTLGWILYKRGEYPRALSVLLESVEGLPAEPEVQLHLGMTYYMMGQREPARIALQRAVQSPADFPGKEDGRKRLALLSIDPKTASAANLQELEALLQTQPNDPVALDLAAGIYERDGNVEKAVKSYNEALKRNPKNVPAMVGLIRLYTGRLNDPEKALELAREAHKLSPDDGYVSHVLGRLVYQKGDKKLALSLFQDASRRITGQPELLYDLAWASYDVGQVTEAETSMQQAVQIGKPFPKLDDAKRFLILVAASKNHAKAQPAAAQAQEILKADPNYIPALMVTAFLQEQQRKTEEAKRIYENILAANPLFTPAVRNLAIIYAQTPGNDVKAYELATKARTAFPEDPVLARTLGILAFRKGEYSRAAQLLKESVQKLKDDGESFYYLGMAQFQLKDRAGSKASLQNALKLNLTDNLATEAKKKLAELK